MEYRFHYFDAPSNRWERSSVITLQTIVKFLMIFDTSYMWIISLQDNSRLMLYQYILHVFGLMDYFAKINIKTAFV